MGLPTNGKRTRRGSRYNANTSLTTDVLPLVEAWLAELPPSPKTDYLREMCFSKFVSSETDPAITRRIRAINKWLATEANNAATNDRLITTDPGFSILPGVRWDRFVDWVSSYINLILGDTVPLDAVIGAFSGGATTSRKRTDGHPALKFVGRADITESAINWFDLVLEECPLWANLSPPKLNLVDGSKLFTVLKNTEIDRVACKEPDINMFLQKGAGGFIRRRLRRFGIDLNDQSRNQRLAQQGSELGALATLDLSSASDSISYSLVHTFLPSTWAGYLSDIRSPSVEIDGELHDCEMFSSMGNGFTFELESLLFFAFCKATAYFTGTRGTISVYGDDLIVPVQIASPLTSVLDFLGFEINTSKSFSDGPFRESCGGHYWNGNDITPFFIRSPIKTLVDLIHLLNSIRIWASRGEGLFLAEEAWTIWDLLSELVPRMFWGGDVVSAGKTQLISPDWPRKRLDQITEKQGLPAVGLYLTTMLALSNREGPPGLGVNSSDSSVVIPRYRVRPAKRWTWHDSGMIFLTECTR